MVGSSKPNNRKRAEPKSKNLIMYEESFLYPLGKSSTHKMKITLQGLFVLVPNPPPFSQQNDRLTISAMTFSERDLPGSK